MVIGCLYDYGDIILFLDNIEINDIEKKSLEGTLIRLSYPIQQGKIIVSVNEERKDENFGIGIGVISKDRSPENYVGIFELFIGDDNYQYLKENGRIGTRYADGQKVTIYSLSELDKFDSDVDLNFPERLKYYMDNRDKIGTRNNAPGN